MAKNRGVSAFIQVSIVTLVVLLLQAGFFYIIFSQLDVVQMIESSTYRYYANSLGQSAYRLEKNMVNKWTSKDAIDAFMDTVETEYWKSKTNNTELKINGNISTGLVDYIKNVDATSCFILLNEQMAEGKGDDQVYFIHDGDERFRSKYNSDLTVELGDYRLANNLGITLGLHWQPDIDLDYYTDIAGIKNAVITQYQSAEEKEDSRLSYWATKQDLLNNGENSFVYVRPIIDEYSKRLYGILGVEIREGLICDVVESPYLNAHYDYGFAVLRGDASSDGSGKANLESYFGDDLKVNKEAQLSYDRKVNSYHDELSSSEDLFIYVVKNEAEKTVYGIEKKLNIYGRDSYFSDDWQLMLLLDERNLHYNSADYSRGIIVAIAISILTAVVLTGIVANLFVTPIAGLVKEIEEMDTNEQIVFSETGIREINMLKDKITEMSTDVANTYIQMQRLLETIGHGIVIFEENRTANTFSRVGRVSVLFQDLDPTEKALEKYSIEDYREVIKIRLRNYKLSQVSSDQIDDDVKVMRVTAKAPLKLKPFYIKYEKKVVNSRIFHVYTDCTEEYLEILKMEYEMNHDPLTQLLSRDYFKHCVEEKLTANPTQSAVMIMWDLDNLKYINDMYGHDWGDEYLRQTASVIGQLSLDKADVSRFAGDEFFVFMAYDGDKDKIRNRIAKIHDRLLSSELVISESESVKIRASVGICWYPDDGMSYDELYKYADFAMYGAKHSDKGCINEFDRSLYDKEYIILSAKEELNNLIENKRIKYAFQPIVNARSAEILGYEALMRPLSNVLETVTDVMLVAKTQFKLAQIEQLTFECVLENIEHNAELFDDKKIFINSVASKTLPLESEARVVQRLQKYGDRIVIEITEAEEINDQTMAVKQSYKDKYGCMIAIDDFGSGYSSDKALLKIKPDLIKIDMHLIRNIHLDGEKQQRVANIIEYSKLVDAMTIAEGVESYQELAHLISIGVDYVQGYYLAKPQFEICDIAKDKKAKIVALQKNRA